MLLKSNKLFVCCSHGLQVIDLAANRATHFLDGLYGASGITTPSTSSKNIYLFAGRSRQEQDPELVLLDAASLKIIARRSWRQQTKKQKPSLIVVDPDEKELLSGGFVNPRHEVHQGRFYDLSGPDLQLGPPREVTIPALPVTKTSYGQRWLAGNLMLDSDLEETLREYSGDFVAFDESRDRFATLALQDPTSANTDMILAIGQISSNEELARLALPAEEGVSRTTRLEQSSRELVFPSVQFDHSGKSALCAYAANCHLVDLQGFDHGKMAEQLQLKPLERNRYPAGLPIAIELGENLAAAELTLTDAPAGVQLLGTRLTWKPTFADIGRHDIHLTIIANGHATSHVLSLMVSLPEVDLPVTGQAMVSDSVGHYTVVFGQPKDQATTSSVKYRPPSQLAMVDLRQLTVVNTLPVSDWPRTAHIVGEYLFWIPKSVDVLKRLDLAQGERIEEMPLPEGTLGEVFPLGDGSLAAIVTNQQEKTAGVVVYRCDSWQPVEGHPLTKLVLRWHRGSFRNHLKRLGDSQRYFYGRVLDESDGSTLCFNTRLFGIANTIHQVDVRDFTALNNRGSYGYAWSTDIGSRMIKRPNEPASIIYYTSKTHQLSRDQPLYLSLESDKRGRQHCYTMELRGLVFGKVLGSYPLPDDVNFRVGYPIDNQYVSISGDKLVCTVGSRLFYYSMPDLSEYLEPLRLLYPKVPPKRVTETLDVTLTARGGKPPYRFDLAEPIDGIELDSRTGMLSIKWPDIWAGFLSAVSSGNRGEVMVYGTHPGVPPGIDALGLNVPADHVPLSVECLLDVTDASGQKDRILASLITIAPFQELTDSVQKGKDVLTEKRVKARESR